MAHLLVCLSMYNKGILQIPPPWLIAMQRYGPPPSYPNLKIPGLNAPIPPDCAFGYHPGKFSSSYHHGKFEVFPEICFVNL